MAIAARERTPVWETRAPLPVLSVESHRMPERLTLGRADARWPRFDFARLR
jgi:hypothetical protein